MWTRLSFVLITAFWLTMTTLLWRSEMAGRRAPGSSVPPSVVWQRILNAPDNSALEIRHGTNRLGFCRWAANVGEELETGVRSDEELLPEGMVKKRSDYTLDVDGSLVMPDLGGRLGFGFSLRLGTNYAWQEFMLRVNLRPDLYELTGSAAERTLTWSTELGGAKTRRVIKLNELQDPNKLLVEIGGPLMPIIVAGLGIPLSTNQLESLFFGLNWQAQKDSLKIGHTRMRVYKVQASLLDRFKAVVYVSPVGEILRAELPNKILLVSEVLNSLPDSPP